MPVFMDVLVVNRRTSIRGTLGSLFILSLAVAIAAPATAAPINPVPYGALTSTGLIDFEDLIAPPFPGASIEGILDLNGASFAERFNGQVLNIVGDFDTLSGLPIGSLSLVAGALNQNVVAANAGGIGIAGLGPLGFPSLSANGEGALAVLMDTDTAEFGFEIRGAEGGSATLSFFRRDGSLIEAVVLLGVTNGFYGFSRDLGIEDIAGVTLVNDDVGGFGVDNILFLQPIPEPSTACLMLIGLAMLNRSGGRR